MIYGKTDTFDVERMIDMLQALEKFVAVKDEGDGTAYKKDGVRGNVYVGKAGEATGTKKVVVADAEGVVGLVQSVTTSTESMSNNQSPKTNQEGESAVPPSPKKKVVRAAFSFFFSDEGELFRVFVLDEVCGGIDALSRDAVRELVFRLGVRDQIPGIFKSLAPKLSDKDRSVVDSTIKLVSFFVGGDISNPTGTLSATDRFRADRLQVLISDQVKSASSREALRDSVRELVGLVSEFGPAMRTFGLQIVSRLVEKSTARLLRFSSNAIFGIQ